MKQCRECERHLFGPEPRCPFCGHAQPETAAHRPGTVLAGLVLGLGLASCGPTVDTSPVDDSGSTGTEAMTSTTLATTTVDVSTGSPTTAGDTSTSTGVDDSQDDAPCAFYAGCPPDVNLDPFPCDLFAQDCVEGEKCLPWANDGGEIYNATRCSPIAENPDEVGEPCEVLGNAFSGIDSCVLGAMCWNVNPDTNQGVCAPLCEGSVDNPLCDLAPQQCVFHHDLVPLCLDACHPLTQDCPEGQGCYYGNGGESFVCMATDDPGAYPAPCDSSNDCDPGSVCMGDGSIPGCEGIACCTSLCDFANPQPCPGEADGVSCEWWWTTVFGPAGRAPPGYEDVGVCVSP